MKQLLKEWNSHTEKPLDPLAYADLGRPAEQSVLVELPEFDANAASLVLRDSFVRTKHFVRAVVAMASCGRSDGFVR